MPNFHKDQNEDFYQLQCYLENGCDCFGCDDFDTCDKIDSICETINKEDLIQYLYDTEEDEE